MGPHDSCLRSAAAGDAIAHNFAGAAVHMRWRHHHGENGVSITFRPTQIPNGSTKFFRMQCNSISLSLSIQSCLHV